MNNPLPMRRIQTFCNLHRERHQFFGGGITGLNLSIRLSYNGAAS
jgi:hypothetical protein